MNTYDQGAHDVLVTLAASLDATAEPGALVRVGTVADLMRSAARDVKRTSATADRRPAPSRAARRAEIIRHQR